VVRGEFTPRGGLNTTVEARWPRPKRKARWAAAVSFRGAGASRQV